MPSVVIAGGGYAGLRATHRLDSILDRTWSITLVDRHDGQELITRLPEVVGGRIAPRQAFVPFARVLSRRVKHVRAEVRGLDPVARRVDTSSGSIVGDFLVVSLGGIPDYLEVPGAPQNSLVMKSLSDSLVLRARIQQLLTSQWLVRVTIVGAGYTGTEVAGELTSWNHRLRRSGDASRIAVTTVAQDEQLLPQGNPELAQVAERVLTREGVRLMLGGGVLSVGEDHIIAQQSVRVDSDLVVWAAHSRASFATHDGWWPRGQDGRILVDPYLRVEGCDRVYAIGDLALINEYSTGAVLPSSAQLAVQEGEVAAHNLAMEARGGSPREFQASVLGEALSLGDGGAADVAGFVISGRGALAVKKAALLRYLQSLGGLRFAAAYI